MTLIKREDAIDAICKEWCYVTYGNCPHVDDGFVCDGCDDVKALNALQSAEIPTKSTNTPTDTPTDLISRADAIEAVCDKCPISFKEKCEWKDNGHCSINVALSELPSSDAVRKGVLEQFRWERDVAMAQLEEYGIPFGTDKDENMVRVVRCKDCRFWKNEHLCLVMSRYGSIDTKAEHYCSYGERSK